MGMVVRSLSFSNLTLPLWCALSMSCAALGLEPTTEQSAGSTAASCLDAQNDITEFLASATAQLRLGTPISETITLNQLPVGRDGQWVAGDALPVQWYNTARLEYHADLAQSSDPVQKAYRVMFGRIGGEHLASMNNGDEHLNREFNFNYTNVPIKTQYLNGALSECDTTSSNYSNKYELPDVGVEMSKTFGFRIHNTVLGAWETTCVRVQDPNVPQYRPNGTCSYMESMMRWGNPLSPLCTLTLGGKTRRVQYFERGRIEVDGETVFTSPLGQEVYATFKNDGLATTPRKSFGNYTFTEQTCAAASQMSISLETTPEAHRSSIAAAECDWADSPIGAGGICVRVKLVSYAGYGAQAQGINVLSGFIFDGDTLVGEPSTVEQPRFFKFEEPNTVDHTQLPKDYMQPFKMIIKKTSTNPSEYMIVGVHSYDLAG